MMMESDIKLLHAFTRGSYHRQNSVVFMVQNNTNKHMRTISLNAQYLVFFKSPATTVSSPTWPDRCSLTRHVTLLNRINCDTRAIRLFAPRSTVRATRRPETEKQHISRREASGIRFKMSQKIRRHCPTLKKILHMRKAARSAAIKKCDRELIDCFSGCAKTL